MRAACERAQLPPVRLQAPAATQQAANDPCPFPWSWQGNTYICMRQAGAHLLSIFWILLLSCLLPAQQPQARRAFAGRAGRHVASAQRSVHSVGGQLAGGCGRGSVGAAHPVVGIASRGGAWGIDAITLELMLLSHTAGSACTAQARRPSPQRRADRMEPAQANQRACLKPAAPHMVVEQVTPDEEQQRHLGHAQGLQVERGTTKAWRWEAVQRGGIEVRKRYRNLGRRAGQWERAAQWAGGARDGWCLQNDACLEGGHLQPPMRSHSMHIVGTAQQSKGRRRSGAPPFLPARSRQCCSLPPPAS